MKRLIAVSCFLLIAFSISAQTDFSDEVAEIVQQSQSMGYDEPVVFIGSSSIKMWKTLESDFSDFQVLNHGFGGAQFSDILNFQNELIGEFEPSMIVVYAGDNDLASGKEPAIIAEQAENFVDGLRRLAHGSPAVIISAKPSVARWELKEKYEELNSLLQEVANGHDHVVFVDVWTPMLKRNGEVNQKLYLEDGLHMNENGYEIWKNALTPFLTK